MNTAHFEGSTTDLPSLKTPPDDSSDVTLVRGREPPSMHTAPVELHELDLDADAEDSPLARLILSHDRSQTTRPPVVDAPKGQRTERPKGLPVAVLTSDSNFVNQIRTALDKTAEINSIGTADEAAELAVSGRCPILITDTAITRSTIESLRSRLRAHDPACVIIVAGSRDQGGMLIGLQSSGAVDGFLLKPATAAATQLVVESASKRHRALGSGVDLAAQHTRVRSRTQTPRVHAPSSADAVALATPTIETHVPRRTAQSVAPVVAAEPRTLGPRTPGRAWSRPSWPLLVAAVTAVGALVWWVTWQRLPDIDPQRVIAEHMTLAQEAQQADRLIGARDSAAYHFQTVLALDPQNIAAQRGLDHIATELSRRTQAFMSQQRLAEAVSSLERLRDLQPDYAELPLLDSQLRVLRDAVLAAHAPAPVADPAAPTETSARTRTASRAAERTPVTGPSEAPPRTHKPTETKPQEPANSTLSAHTAKAPPATPDVVQQVAPASNTTVEQVPVTIGPPAATLASNTLPKIPTTLPQVSEPTAAPSTSNAPKILKYVEPVYPREAHARSMEGWVKMRLQVAPNGDVVNSRIEDGERRQLFARAALAAVRQWKYEPRPESAGEAPVVVRLEFKLDR